MCDYSLEAYQSQLAAMGGRYILELFPSGAKGFATERGCMIAVCMAADTKLRLEGISQENQVAFGINESEEVTMTRLDWGPYRDAVVFSDDRVALLQRLNAGVHATVLSLPERHFDADELKRRVETYTPATASRPYS